MENSEINATKRLPTSRSLKHHPLKDNETKPTICRVCLEASAVMVNIFETPPGSRISIADMISHSTGFSLSQGDSYPHTICPPCLKDAQSAFEIKQVYEKSYRIYCQMKKDNERGLLIPIKSESVKNKIIEDTYLLIKEKVEEFQVKNELIEEDEFEGIEEAESFQVKNEPIDEDSDSFEEEDGQSWDSKADWYDCLVKSEEIEDYDGGFEGHIPTHTAIRSRVKCSQCQKTYAHKYALKAHMIITHSGERPHKCSHCERAFAVKNTLTKHLRTHTGERPYKCSQCQRTFAQSSTLRIHIKYHNKEQAFPCSHCPKSFVIQNDLQRHIRTHTGERPYQCIHCSKTYKSRAQLQTHLLIHTGERPHKCSHCPKDFTTSQHLGRHIRVHTGEKPYRCTKCTQAFSIQSNLKRHLEKQHKEY